VRGYPPSLYRICQALYEEEWNEKEDTSGWQCICGWKKHLLVLRGTPILCKPGDKVEIKMDKVIDGMHDYDMMFVMGKVIETLGKTVTIVDDIQP
jgi:hypothetical protein